METLPVNGHFLSMYVPAEPVLCQQCQECLINSDWRASTLPELNWHRCPWTLHVMCECLQRLLTFHGLPGGLEAKTHILPVPLSRLSRDLLGRLLESAGAIMTR